MNALARKTVSIVLSLAIAGSLFSSALVSGLVLRRIPHGTTTSLLVALLPLPFFAASFLSMFWFARRCDEMQRRIQFEALAFAYPLSMFAFMGLFLVRKAGFPVALDLGDVFLAMAAAYMLGALLAWNRYR